MKKTIIFLLIIIIAILIVGINYASYKFEHDIIMSENAEFEEFKDKEIYGLDIVTIINKAVDKNTKNEIPSDENGIFIQNESNSIEIEIYMKDNETTYKMETFFNSGTDKFIKYYGHIKFKCSKIEYHEETGKIKYILFEQL